MERQPTPDFAIYLLSFLPSRPEYDVWINVISAIGNTFDLNTSIQILLSRFIDEKPNEHEIKLKNRLKNISFGTLVYYAKQNGYVPEKSTHTNGLYAAKQVATIPNTTTKRIEFETPPKIIMKCCEFIEDVISIYMSDGLTRQQAEKITLDGANFVKPERIYDIAVNRNILNKNLHPATKEPYLRFDSKSKEMVLSYTELTNGFKNYSFSLLNIAKCIGRGYAIVCSRMKSDTTGNIVRKNDNLLHSDLFAIDVDNKEPENYMSIEKALTIPETRKALLVYTTPSFTEQIHRFRILFPFPRRIFDPEQYRLICEHFINIYGADKACKDPVRAFYGNDNATIYLIQTGEVMEFRNGVLI